MDRKVRLRRVTIGSAALIDEADKATASGNLNRAEQLLRQACEGATNDPSIFLKLAALQRANGRLQQALNSVHRALAISPLDFTALLLRASLLDRMSDPSAPEAWSHAIAQKPHGELPPHLEGVVATAMARVDQWTAKRDARIAVAMEKYERSANPDEHWRLQRFRSNVLRRTRPYHSEPTHFHFPALEEREFYPRHLFPWMDKLEGATEIITSELKALMASDAAELVPYVQYADHLPLDQWRELNKNQDWSAIHLLQNGEVVEANARFCPRTMDVLEQCNQPKIRGASPNAMFSLLAPKTHIPAHVGVNNTRLVCHLPLVVPEGCWFRVGAERRSWEAGKAFVFDDTIEHEADNPTEQLRVVFIFDTWQPQLSSLERDAVRCLIEADGLPGDYS